VNREKREAAEGRVLAGAPPVTAAGHDRPMFLVIPHFVEFPHLWHVLFYHPVQSFQDLFR
jgi:hypothetical protein